MTKTNKSFAKRLKITKNGKVLRRVSGQNHFNAKAPRRKQLKQKGLVKFNISAKNLNRALPYR